MCTDSSTTQRPGQIPNPSMRSPVSKSASAADGTLSLWRVDFASGGSWYQVGEFVAADGSSAIEHAVAVFGEASSYRATEIPWGLPPR